MYSNMEDNGVVTVQCLKSHKCILLRRLISKITLNMDKPNCILRSFPCGFCFLLFRQRKKVNQKETGSQIKTVKTKYRLLLIC